MIQGRTTNRSGMTLIEVSMGAVFLAFIGYLLTTTIQMSSRTHTTVMESVNNLESLRSGAGEVRSAVRQTSDSLITITTLATGDSELTLQEPIIASGNPAWGVYEFELGSDETSRTKEDWFLRFTVDAVAAEGGGIQHDLVRQVIDNAGGIQLEDTLVTDLFQGDATDPGFEIQNVGDVWEAKIQTAGVIDGTKGPSTTLHIRTRN